MTHSRFYVLGSGDNFEKVEYFAVPIGYELRTRSKDLHFCGFLVRRINATVRNQSHVNNFVDHHGI